MSSGGSKYDTGKPPLGLIPYEALEEIAKVLDFGKKKYDPWNWTKGIEYQRLIDAALRHINQFNTVEDNDNESSVSHVAHAACCLIFILWMQKHRPDMDNRFKRGKVV